MLAAKLSSWGAGAGEDEEVPALEHAAASGTRTNPLRAPRRDVSLSALLSPTQLSQGRSAREPRSLPRLGSSLTSPLASAAARDMQIGAEEAHDSADHRRLMKRAHDSFPAVPSPQGYHR